MYTRNPMPQRVSAQKSSPMTGFGLGNRTQDQGNLPILIPKDYRGEFLRDRIPEPPPERERESAAETAVWEESEAVSADPADLEPVSAGLPDLTVQQAGTEASPSNSGTGSLLGGLYDLLIGENSTEEETILLLAIGLLLLWGHLDRGGLFDRSTWDGDDLALLLIGYLLLS
ncbi:MAG: hypothetical protein E7604_03870 [Ruminococcaceae bacterium]|nr:hypothetical protein [Oscillospiraceae bacterium]